MVPLPVTFVYKYSIAKCKITLLCNVLIFSMVYCLVSGKRGNVRLHYIIIHFHVNTTNVLLKPNNIITKIFEMSSVLIRLTVETKFITNMVL